MECDMNWKFKWCILSKIPLCDRRFGCQSQHHFIYCLFVCVFWSNCFYLFFFCIYHIFHDLCTNKFLYTVFLSIRIWLILKWARKQLKWSRMIKLLNMICVERNILRVFWHIFFARNCNLRVDSHFDSVLTVTPTHIANSSSPSAPNSIFFFLS